MYIEELRNYGLSEKEAKIYLALLKLGPSTVNNIAEECNLIRTTTYDVLKTLREKAIVASMVKNRILYFEAADPKKLIQILEEKKVNIERILPKLRNLRTNIPNMPRSEVFEGKEGLKTVFQELLQKKEALYAYSNNELMVNILPYFSPRFIKNRVKAKIPIKIISEPSKTTTDLLIKKDKKEFRETKVLSEFKNIPINQYIAGDMITILGSRIDEPVGIIIHHKDFAKAQRIIFDKLWKIAKK